MESCDMQIQNYLQWEREAVIEPCKTWVRSLFTHAQVTDVSEFGSRDYRLGLPATDFDILFNTASGGNWKDMLRHLAKAAKSDPRFTGCRRLHLPMKTFNCKFFSVHADIKVTVGWAADNATKSTDLLRILLESRVEVVLQACRAWKLLMYHLRLCARHLEGKLEQFKSITLTYFAVAVIDRMLATNSGTSAASALLGVVNAFMTFGFDQHQVHVSDNGLTSITQKSDVCRDDVVIWLDVQEGNCTDNVDAANVAKCKSHYADLHRLERLR